jgi:hypothetical protein
MSLGWLFLAALIVILLIAYLLIRPAGARGWMLWQLRDGSREDRQLEAFVAEEELKRTSSQRDRDLAP